MSDGFPGIAMNSDQLIDFLIAGGQAWVTQQRELHRPAAIPLDALVKGKLKPFFEDAILNEARFKEVAAIENPGFYAEIEASGQPIPLDFTAMHGITFIDTVLLSTRFGQVSFPSLLFHELVHVVQYRILGVAEFVDRYVRGWAANGFAYEAIPLERDAYELQHRYEASPAQPFSVREKVEQRLKRQR